MAIYERNLKSKGKGIAMIVEPDESIENESYNYPVILENIISKSGLLTTKIKMNESDAGFFMHSSYDPVSEAKRQIESLNYDKNGMFIVFGIGLGYQLLEIKKRMTEKSKVVVIENSVDVYNNTMRNIKLKELLEDNRFTFIIDLNIGQTIMFLREMMRIPVFFYLLSNVQFVTLSYYEKMFPRKASEFTKILLEKILGKWHSLGNAAVDTIVGLVQNFYNIDEAIFNPGIDYFIDKYKNKPTIVVSAGPSLDKNIELIKEAEGKAVIIACDASLRALVKKGIKPDVVVSLERVTVYDQLLKNRDYEIAEDIVWAGPPLVEPNVFKEFKKNKKIICYKAGETINTWIDEILGGKGTIYMGNSVAHVAFGFALKIGADPIILTGQDLAFSENGDTHGSGITDVVKQATTHYTQPKQIIYLKDSNDKPIRSTILWKTMLIEFENMIMQCKGRTFIDATEGGAYIRGTKVMTLRETIDKYIKDQTIERVNDIIPKVNVDKPEEIYKTLIKSVDEKRALFKKMNDMSQECLDNIRITKKEYDERYKTINEEQKQSICNVLVKSNEVYELMKTDILTIIFFQGLMTVFVVEINKLGLELSNENVWNNLLLQEDFLLITRDTCIAVVAVMDKILEFLKDKADGKPAETDFSKYLSIEIIC